MTVIRPKPGLTFDDVLLVPAESHVLPNDVSVRTKLTFSPPWDPRTMASEDVKMQLGIW